VLALWTGQRQGDLIRATWSQYNGSHIRLRQSKGGKRVTIPTGSVLKAALDSRRQSDGTILRNTFGEPWTSVHVNTSVSEATIFCVVCIYQCHCRSRPSRPRLRSST
jgi:integrase